MCAASTPSRCSATKIWSFVYAKERNVCHARSAPRRPTTCGHGRPSTRTRRRVVAYRRCTGTHMKTTMGLADDLVERAKALAIKQRTTLRRGPVRCCPRRRRERQRAPCRWQRETPASQAAQQRPFRCQTFLPALLPTAGPRRACASPTLAASPRASSGPPSSSPGRAACLRGFAPRAPPLRALDVPESDVGLTGGTSAAGARLAMPVPLVEIHRRLTWMALLLQLQPKHLVHDWYCG